MSNNLGSFYVNYNILDSTQWWFRMGPPSLTTGSSQANPAVLSLPPRGLLISFVGPRWVPQLASRQDVIDL